MIYNSHLKGHLEMSIRNEVIFTGNDMSGFLTVGESINGSIVWNRRWCKAEGLILNFWNYPDQASEKSPVEVIDISKCENVLQADRKDCPRPRAIEIKQPNSNTSINPSPDSYFLLTDSKQELKEWLRELKKMLQFVHDWRI